MAWTPLNLTLASAVLLAGTAVAQQSAPSSTVVAVTMAAVDQQPILGSVISVGPTATEYYLNCPPFEDPTQCGLGDGVTVLAGPSTFVFSGIAASAFSFTVDCVLAAGTAACTQTDSGPGISASLGVQVFSDLPANVIPVTLTAGLDKLAAGGASSPATVSATTSVPTATQTQSSISSSGSSVTQAAGGTSRPSSSVSSSPSSSVSKAGVPRVTQHAMMAGVAALVGGAIVL